MINILKSLIEKIYNIFKQMGMVSGDMESLRLIKIKY